MRRTAHVLALAAALGCGLAAVMLARLGLSAPTDMPRMVHFATACTLLSGAITAAATAARIRRRESRSPLLLVGVTAFHVTLLYYCVRFLASL